MRLGLLLCSFFIFIASILPASPQIKLKARKHQAISHEKFLQQMQEFSQAFKRFENFSDFTVYPMPYPVPSGRILNEANNFFLCQKYYNRFVSTLVQTINAQENIEYCLQSFEAPLIIVYYFKSFSSDSYLMASRRMAFSRCFMSFSSSNDKNLCVCYAIFLLGPRLTDDSQVLPWIVVRTLLIKVDLYPRDELASFQSVLRMLVAAFQKLERLECKARKGRLEMEVVAEYILILKDALCFFESMAVLMLRRSERLVYAAYLGKLKTSQLYRAISRHYGSVEWSTCFPFVAEHIKPMTTAQEEINKAFVYYFGFAFGIIGIIAFVIKALIF